MGGLSLKPFSRKGVRISKGIEDGQTENCKKPALELLCESEQLCGGRIAEALGFLVCDLGGVCDVF